jgi:hypothetical protein
MKILLCGEGAHDIGEPYVWSTRDQKYVSVEGWMQAFCRKILGNEIPIEFEVRKRKDILLIGRDASRHNPLPAGHGAKSLAARLAAEREGFAAIVFMVDADTKNAADWRQKRKEVVNGFGRAQNSVPAVACVPMSASESWLLADSCAWARIGLADPAMLPQRPEEIWGARNDPDGDHPHQFFRRVCRAISVADNRETRYQIALDSNLSALSNRCKLSFETFRSDLATI